MNGIAGLVIGAVMKVVVPYVRVGLEKVAESGSGKSWPKFDYRYVAMMLVPMLEYGVAFLITPGLWQAALEWTLIPAISLGYAGTDIGKEIVQGAAAVYRFARKR